MQFLPCHHGVEYLQQRCRREQIRQPQPLLQCFPASLAVRTAGEPQLIQIISGDGIGFLRYFIGQHARLGERLQQHVFPDTFHAELALRRGLFLAVLLAVDIGDIDVIQLPVSDCTLQVIPNLKACPIGVGEHNDAGGSGVILNQRHFLRIPKDAEAVGDENHRIQNGGELDLIVLSLHHNCLCNMNHVVSPYPAVICSMRTMADSSSARSGVLVEFS